MEFYSDTENTVLISSATIPIADIQADSGVPNAPTTNGTYVLQVDLGTVTWEPQEDIAQNVTFARDDGSYAIQPGDISGGVDKTLSMSDFTGIPTGTTLSAAHTLLYSGFVLLPGFDYTYDLENSTVTILAATISAVNPSPFTFDLNNYRATLS